MDIVYGSLCSGIGTEAVAWAHLGWRQSWCAEIDPACSAILAARHPGLPNLGDICADDFIGRAKTLGPVDLVVGGPPCQAFSLAGARGGLSDPRGRLTLRYVEIVDGLDPLFAVWENVVGVLSQRDNAFGCLIAGLVGADAPIHPPGGRWPRAGVVDGPRRLLAWRIVDAWELGSPQTRPRVFVVAGRAGDPRGARALLPGPGCLPHVAGDSRGPAVAAASRGGRGAAPGSGAWSFTVRTRSHGRNLECRPNVAYTLTNPGKGGRTTDRMVLVPTETDGGVVLLPRTLMPVEGERIQGLPDGYTAIDGAGLADTARFRALGNGFSVWPLKWIGERLRAVCAPG